MSLWTLKRYDKYGPDVNLPTDIPARISKLTNYRPNFNFHCTPFFCCSNSSLPISTHKVLNQMATKRFQSEN